MDKQQILAFISEQIALGKINQDDLLSLRLAPNTPSEIPVSVPIKEENSKHVSHILYAIGAIIALVGVIVLISQNWYEIGFAGRIGVTLGIALATYITGLLLKNPEHNTLSQVMFTIAAVLAPIGAFVFMDEMRISISWSTQLLTSLILLAVFGTALMISRKSILLLITTGFASWAYFALLFKALDLSYGNYDTIKWATMFLGASFIFIGYGYRAFTSNLEAANPKERRAVQNVLYGFGTLAILGSGIIIGGFFDLLFIALIFAAFYGSVYLKSRAMLGLGALFLMAHIIKLTSKYFISSIGWPVALILVGFLVIGVGYLSLYLNKRFISQK